jgi:predicted ATPase/DNA-binding CsgD family transcriptional regulator
LLAVRARATIGAVPAGELIGRERELASLTAMLGDPEARLVTVTGPAGVGKTRLALAASEAVRPERPDGVVHVDLAPLEDARLVAEAIAAAAGAGSSRGASALEAATAALRERRTLLVLDNFEHVEPAAGDLGALLDGCPGVTALVTSRHVLGLSAERTLPLAPLSTPAADGGEAQASAAVALFVARARARDPSFELTPDIVASVAEICRRLDGLPLAIELAAARVAVLAPPAMLARWDAAVGLDTVGARDLPSRQRTLRSAIDWSYDLLDSDEQALLRRLAAFADGFDVTAVEAAQRGDGGVLVALELDPLSALAALMDRSLLHRAAGSATEPRFSMLVTVRLYLRGRLAERGEAVAADLWMATVCAAAAHAEGRVFGAGSSAEELDRLDRDLNNLRAALEVLLVRAPPRALELAADLDGLWDARHVREGRDWLERALRAAGPDASPAVRARALFAAVWLAHFQGDYGARGRLADECLTAAQAADDPLLMARALYAAGVALVDTDAAGAEARYRESLALCERLGDDVGIATASNDLGELARAAGALDDAQAQYGRALGLWRATGDRTGIARGAHNLAQAARDLGDLARAADLLRESLAASAQMGDRHQRAWTLAALAAVAAERQPDIAAATLYGAAEAEIAAAAIVLETIDAEPFARADSALRAALGEERAREAQARGRGLALEQTDLLVERLLSGDEGSAPTDSVLSRREREVVGLLAAGLTNAEIASRLVLSEHTVHRHVANILVKLGARSRAAAAVTAAERGLL